MHHPQLIRGGRNKRRNVLSEARTCDLSLCLKPLTPPTELWGGLFPLEPSGAHTQEPSPCYRVFTEQTTTVDRKLKTSNA